MTMNDQLVEKREPIEDENAKPLTEPLSMHVETNVRSDFMEALSRRLKMCLVTLDKGEYASESDKMCLALMCLAFPESEDGAVSDGPLKGYPVDALLGLLDKEIAPL